MSKIILIPSIEAHRRPPTTTLSLYSIPRLMQLVSSHNTLPCHRCNNSSLLLTLISSRRRRPLKQSFCSSSSYFYCSNNRHSNNSSNKKSSCVSNSNKKSICVNNSSFSFNSSNNNNNCNSNRTYLQPNKTCLHLNSLCKLNLLASGKFYSSFIPYFLITIFYLTEQTTPSHLHHHLQFLHPIKHNNNEDPHPLSTSKVHTKYILLLIYPRYRLPLHLLPTRQVINKGI